MAAVSGGESRTLGAAPLFPTAGHLAERTELPVLPDREAPSEGQGLVTGKRQPASRTSHNAQKTIPKYSYGFELPREYKRIKRQGRRIEED